MYYPLGGKRVILCGVFMANKTEKGGLKKAMQKCKKKCFSSFCFWFVKSTLISELVNEFNAKEKQFQIH